MRVDRHLSSPLLAGTADFEVKAGDGVLAGGDGAGGDGAGADDGAAGSG